MGSTNLKPPSAEEARSRGKKGGQASGASRRKKRALRECLEAILASPMDDDKICERLRACGLENTYDYAMSFAVIERALMGDARAFEVVRDTIGQKPKDKMETENTGKIVVTFGGEGGEFAE